MNSQHSASETLPLLVLDLDETLVHATETPLFEEREPDFQVLRYAVYCRPGLNAFLETAFRLCRVAVWTSSGSDYAMPCAKRIEPAGRRFDWVWTRDRCTARRDPATDRPYWEKNFNKLRKRGEDLDRVVAVDDSPEKHRKQYGNFVRVEPWEGAEEDRELERLGRYLEEELLPMLDAGGSIRTIEKRGWRRQIG